MLINMYILKIIISKKSMHLRDLGPYKIIIFAFSKIPNIVGHY